MSGMSNLDCRGSFKCDRRPRSVHLPIAAEAAPTETMTARTPLEAGHRKFAKPLWAFVNTLPGRIPKRSVVLSNATHRISAACASPRSHMDGQPGSHPSPATDREGKPQSSSRNTMYSHFVCLANPY